MFAKTRLSLAALSVLWLAGALSAASAAPATSQWQRVADQAGSIVEIDQARISRLKNGKTSAWTRLTLDHPVLDFESQTRYTAVQALNHYDCANGTFATQKRVFLLDGREIKTEKVSGTPVAAQSGGFDALLVEAACRPRTVSEMVQVAQKAEMAAQGASEKQRDNAPRAMHAEMVSADVGTQPGTIKVADKPRFIDMPAIDKSKAEDPYRSAAPAAPAPLPLPVPAPTVRAAPPPAPAAVTAPAAVAAPAVAASGTKPAVPVQELSRQQRELMLATSGPRKAAKKPVDAEPPPPDYSKARWGYAGLGAPENWSKIKREYATCGNGKRQSPIDIRGGIKVDLEPIKFNYRPSHFRVVDNGHTVQVDVGEGNSITVLGREYQLLQFHFHRPSEERINGKAYDMVAHFVHKDYDNNTAVVAVLLERGMENPHIQTVWNYMPLEVGLDVQPPDAVIDLARFLPEQREYYTYMGSLTTPPCSENVLWMVMKQPVPVSTQQIGIFARLYPNNARPVQPTHDRLIKESR